MKRGVQRWIVDISAWNFSPSEFTSAMSVLPQQEHSSITRYVKMEDRKRALVSRLLQYAVVHEVFGIPFDKIMIKRTVEGKPYLELDEIGHEFPNFNFSVSHHGDFVAIASEPLCLVGLDIVSHVLPVKGTIPEFIEHLSPYFSSTEWSKITNCGTCDNMLEELYRYWSLKEAFVKAIGSGLGYSLDALEFHHCNWTNISLKIHGKEVRHWRFWHFVLRKRHYQAGIQCCAERVSWDAAKQTALLLYFLWFSWILRSRDQKKSADKELQAAESVSERIAATCGSRYGARSRISPGMWN